jgi:hypothetical protein
MVRAAVVALVVALVGCESWTHRDTALEAAFFAATTVDWQQTQDITADCGEVNPVLGPCGQRVPVGVYFPLVLAAHAAISSLLPPSWRTTFQAFTLGTEISTTYWNTRTVVQTSAVAH